MIAVIKDTKKLLFMTMVLLSVVGSLLFIVVPKSASAQTCYTETGTLAVAKDTHTCPDSGVDYKSAAGQNLSDAPKAGACYVEGVDAATKVYTQQNCSDLEALRVAAGGEVSVGEEPTYVTNDCNDGDINQDNCGIIRYIVMAINLLAALVGVVVIGSIIYGGIQYSTAGSDPQKVSAAKNRIRNAVFALLFFIFAYSFLNYLVPGGVL